MNIRVKRVCLGVHCSALPFSDTTALFLADSLDFHHRVSETSYKIVGSAPSGVVSSLCREMNVDMQVFIVVTPDVNLLSSYTELFGYSYDEGQNLRRPS